MPIKQTCLTGKKVSGDMRADPDVEVTYRNRTIKAIACQADQAERQAI